MTDTSKRPGVQTSEFKVTLVLIGIGVALLLLGRPEAEGILAAAGIGYTGSRGLAKK